MFKRVLYGSGATVALATAFLLGSVTLHGAFAAGPTPQPSPQATVQAGQDQQDQQPSYTGSIQVPQDPSGQNEQAGPRRSKARLSTADQAKAAALAQFPGATVQKAELNNENGTLVYSVQLSDTAGTAHDVKVDAGNAKVLQVEAAGADRSEAGTGRGESEAGGAED